MLHSGAAYVHLRPFGLAPERQPSKISGNHLCSRISCDRLLLFAPYALPRASRSKRMVIQPAGRHFNLLTVYHAPGTFRGHCAQDLHKDTVMIPPRRRASAAATRICAPAGAWWCVRRRAGENGAARQGNSDRAHAPERVTVSPLMSATHSGRRIRVRLAELPVQTDGSHEPIGETHARLATLGKVSLPSCQHLRHSPSTGECRTRRSRESRRYRVLFCCIPSAVSGNVCVCAYAAHGR